MGGYGHVPTFELSQGKNTDLTNDCHWWPMTSCKWFSPGFHILTVNNCKIWQTVVLCFVTCNYVAKLMLRGAMSRTVAIICIVLQLIANYPPIIAVHENSLNVGMYPDPGPRVQKRTSSYSDGSHTSCVHSIKNTSDYSDGSHHASCMHSFWSYSLVPTY